MGNKVNKPHMKLFYEEGNDVFSSEYERMKPYLNEFYGPDNYTLIPIDISSRNREQIAKNIGSHIKGSSSTTDFTILGHNKSTLSGLFISDEIAGEYDADTPNVTDTWSEIFAEYQPDGYTGTCYFGSCSMGDPDRLKGFERSMAESFADESGVETKAQVGPWTGIKQGINPQTWDEAFFDPFNKSGAGGSYITITDDGTLAKTGSDETTTESAVASNTSTGYTQIRRPLDYIPQSQRKTGGPVEYQTEGVLSNTIFTDEIRGGNDLNNPTDAIYTYENNPQWFDSRALFHDNQEYSDIIREKVYAGTHGYNPATGALTVLNTPVSVPTNIQTMSTREYGEAAPLNPFKAGPGQARYDMLNPDDQAKWTANAKTKRKNFVASEMQEAFKNPLMYAPAASVALFNPITMRVMAQPLLGGLSGTSMFDLLAYDMAYRGAKNIYGHGQEFAESPSWSGAGKIGWDALGIIAGGISGGNLIKAGKGVAAENQLFFGHVADDVTTYNRLFETPTWVKSGTGTLKNTTVYNNLITHVYATGPVGSTQKVSPVTTQVVEMASSMKGGASLPQHYTHTKNIKKLDGHITAATGGKDGLPLTRITSRHEMTIKNGKVGLSTKPHIEMKSVNKGVQSAHDPLANTLEKTRNTTHWAYGHVGGKSIKNLWPYHGGGNWDDMSTAVISNFSALRSNSIPLHLAPTDTYFYTKGSHWLKSNSSLIITRDQELYLNIMKNAPNQPVYYTGAGVPNQAFADLVNTIGRGATGGLNTKRSDVNKYFYNWIVGQWNANKIPSPNFKSDQTAMKSVFGTDRVAHPGRVRYDGREKTIHPSHWFSYHASGHDASHGGSVLTTLEKVRQKAYLRSYGQTENIFLPYNQRQPGTMWDSKYIDAINRFAKNDMEWRAAIDIFGHSTVKNIDNVSGIPLNPLKKVQTSYHNIYKKVKNPQTGKIEVKSFGKNELPYDQTLVKQYNEFYTLPLSIQVNEIKKLEATGFFKPFLKQAKQAMVEQHGFKDWKTLVHRSGQAKMHKEGGVVNMKKGGTLPGASENFKAILDHRSKAKNINKREGGTVNPQAPPQKQQNLIKPSGNATDIEKRDYWLNLNSNKNFVKRILDPTLNKGKEVPHPETNLPMTHYMTSVEVEGKNLVIPLVVDVGKDKFHYFKDVDEAVRFAIQTGEYILTDTPEEAQWLAAEAYKTDKFKNLYGAEQRQEGGWFELGEHTPGHVAKYQDDGVLKNIKNKISRQLNFYKGQTSKFGRDTEQEFMNPESPYYSPDLYGYTAGSQDAVRHSSAAAYAAKEHGFLKGWLLTNAHELEFLRPDDVGKRKRGELKHDFERGVTKKTWFKAMMQDFYNNYQGARIGSKADNEEEIKRELKELLDNDKFWLESPEYIDEKWTNPTPSKQYDWYKQIPTGKKL